MSWTNDDLANATGLSGASGSITPLAYDGSTDPATSETGEDVYGAGETLWWKWTAPSSGSFAFATVGSPSADADPHGLDTVIQVFSGPSSGATIADLVYVARNDDNAAGDDYTWNSRVIFSAVSGTTYYVQVDMYGSGQAGTLHLDWGAGPLPPYTPPTWAADSGSGSFDEFSNFGHYIGTTPSINAHVAGGLLILMVAHCDDVDLVIFSGGYSQAPDGVYPGFNQVAITLPDPLPSNLRSGPVTVRATRALTGVQYFATSNVWFFPLVHEPDVDDAHGWRDLPFESHSYTNPAGGDVWRTFVSQTWDSAHTGLASANISPTDLRAGGATSDSSFTADVLCGRFCLNDVVGSYYDAVMPDIPAGMREHDGDPLGGSSASRVDPASGDAWGWERENLLQPPVKTWPENQTFVPRYDSHVKQPSEVLHFGFVTGISAPTWPSELRVYLVPPSMWTDDGSGHPLQDPIDRSGFSALHLAGSVTVPTTASTAFTVDATVPEAYIGASGDVVYRVAFGAWVDSDPIVDGTTDVILKYAVSDSNFAENCLHSVDITYRPWGYRYWIPVTSAVTGVLRVKVGTDWLDVGCGTATVAGRLRLQLPDGSWVQECCAGETGHPLKIEDPASPGNWINVACMTPV